jgi:predicted AlkP superfamily pyrophosphatase or phosphodiesterase
LPELSLYNLQSYNPFSKNIVMLFSAILSFCVQAQNPVYDHVFLISIDGLRSDALLVEQAQSFHNFQRLMTGALTLNARTDCDATTTLPNHTGMLTSRLAKGPQGHGYLENSMPPSDAVLKDADGKLIESIFNRTAAEKIHSSLIASKPKFILYQQSYGDIIDDFFINSNADKEMEHLFADLTANAQNRSLNFVHFLLPDVAGHYYGWDLSPDSKYMQSIAASDALLGQLFEYLDANPEYAKRTAIVLTSDHGGGAPHHNHHGIGHLWVNYVIPFIVWTGDGKANGDLIKMNSDSHSNPGIDDPRPESIKLPVIRNCDSGNLCLSLLGLPSINDSTRNVGQELLIMKND